MKKGRTFCVYIHKFQRHGSETGDLNYTKTVKSEIDLSGKCRASAIYEQFIVFLKDYIVWNNFKKKV